MGVWGVLQVGCKVSQHWPDTRCPHGGCPLTLSSLRACLQSLPLLLCTTLFGVCVGQYIAVVVCMATVIIKLIIERVPLSDSQAVPCCCGVLTSLILHSACATCLTPCLYSTDQSGFVHVLAALPAAVCCLRMRRRWKQRQGLGPGVLRILAGRQPDHPPCPGNALPLCTSAWSRICNHKVTDRFFARAGSGAQAQTTHSGGVVQSQAAGTSQHESKAAKQTPGPSTLLAPGHDCFAFTAPASRVDCSPFDAWEDALGAAEEHCVPDALAGMLGAHREPLGSLAQPLDACSGSDGEADWDRLMAAACRASDSPSGSPRGVHAAIAHSPAAGAAESSMAGEPKAESPAGEHGAWAPCSLAWSGPCAGPPASSGGAAAAGAARGDGGVASAEREGGQAGRRRGRPRRYDVGQLLQGAPCSVACLTMPLPACLHFFGQALQ